MGSRPLTAIPTCVSQCLQLAILLEVSAYPKPGNVHRTANFDETRYEHFLASAVAVYPHFTHIAQRGVNVVQGKIGINQIGVGDTVKSAVSEVALWQRDKNTLLGSIILLSPMAAAAGLTLAKNGRITVDAFRNHLVSVVESTTSKDAVDVYDAIEMARPGGLGKAPILDVKDSKSRQRILSQDTSLYEVFKISSPWDSISAEWVNRFHITFDIGYPHFKHEIKETGDVNTASVHTFLKILSAVPDTLIARKAGEAKAKWASEEARKVLDEGGLATEKGSRRLLRLDRQLHDASHRLNPGATADIISAVLAVAILEGYRP
ncbi:MAG TPA: triphosphoribosyl-dephospho-CoA synthase [Candidatus Bathyarchaeia archaeon]|nr:triphosphoribosyl-dephospho-CoA synthase [Candidatus Bathyarchaeia archaeon]